MARTIALWAFGLFGAAIAGALIVGFFYDEHTAIWGFLAGNGRIRLRTAVGYGK